jgi:hypothetical protein
MLLSDLNPVMQPGSDNQLANNRRSIPSQFDSYIGAMMAHFFIFSDQFLECDSVFFQAGKCLPCLYNVLSLPVAFLLTAWCQITMATALNVDA